MSKRCKEHDWEISEFDSCNNKMVCRNCGKTWYKKLSIEKKIERAIKRHPELKEKLKYNSNRRITKLARAWDKYPDLKVLSDNLAIRAYGLREEFLREEQSNNTSGLAGARSDISMGLGNLRYSNLDIPEDLKLPDFKKECVVCFRKEKGINICADCWELLRKALEIKTYHSREGWDVWGYEVDLDLKNIVQLLKSDPEGKEILKRKIEKEKELAAN